MVYRDFQGMRLSALGMGAMRLPVVNGNDAEIDSAATEEMVAYAMEHGVNYYDTAWGYHNGNSELVMGKALAKYLRDSFYLATKFPGYDLSNMPKVKEIFEKQLEKCGVDYFDFYLFHNVCEMNIDAYLDEKYGIYTYLMEQKKNGRIKHLGFSVSNVRIFSFNCSRSDIPESVTTTPGMLCKNRNAHAGIPSSGRKPFNTVSSFSASFASRPPRSGSITQTGIW